MKPVVLLCFIAVNVWSCASSAHTTAVPVETAEEPAAEAVLEILPVSPYNAGLFIETDPPYAKVYINNEFYDTSPLRSTELDYGIYYITVKKQGYYPFSAWITFSEEKRFYRITLQPLLGTLALKVTPSNAIMDLGGKPILQGETRVAAGSYILNVRAFGYNDIAQEVTITENRTTSLVINMETAAQSISLLSPQKAIFNPHNPGVLGRARLFFMVSREGGGKAVIRDSQGLQVYTYTFPPFTQWSQSFTWNGRDENGNIMPDGMYTVEVSVGSGQGNETIRAHTSVTIDSAYRVNYRNLWSGSGGLLYAPTLDLLSPGSLQLQTLIGARFIPPAGDPDFAAPAVLGTRIGLPSDSELDGSVKFVIQDFVLNPPFAVSLSYKKAFVLAAESPEMYAGILVKITYQHRYYQDPFANYNGGALGIPLHVKLGEFSFVVCPEIVVSWQKISYSSSVEENYGFYTWLYGRAGIFYDTTYLLCGLSFSMRTIPFTEGLAPAAPILAAFEINALVPDSPLFISGFVGTEFTDFTHYYLLGGFGLGMLW
jgi:hypothetical protein